MEHAQSGVDWVPEGAVLLCTCAHVFPPVAVGRGWIEELQSLWDQHLEAP